ncbi:MAG: hypothetical protein EXS00_07890 [Phycisphaerales bacterium]|nr:hypothetical protein [Phycisphaerales bacterium]
MHRRTYCLGSRFNDRAGSARLLLGAAAFWVASLASAAPQTAAPGVTAPVAPVVAPAPAIRADRSEFPALPRTPSAIIDVVVAQPFALELPFESEWRADQSVVSRGWLVVLRAPEALLIPRQTAEPVLYAGSTTAIRVAHGYTSGYMVAIVPACHPVDEGGVIDADAWVTLADTAIWFGSPLLPERVDARLIAEETLAAAAAGITDLGNAAATKALAARASLVLKDRAALAAVARELVAQWAPAELAEAPQDAVVP